MSILSSRLVVLWFVVATILVTWVFPSSTLKTNSQDAIYCFGRPHTMEGGALHWPLYTPYKLFVVVSDID